MLVILCNLVLCMKLGYLDHMHRPDAKLVLLYHPEDFRSVAMMSPSIVHEMQTLQVEKTDSVTEKYSQMLKKREVQAEFTEAKGEHTGKAIIDAATKIGATCIVVGSRGHGTIRRTVLGSVSDFVVHHSYIPVVVCHRKQSH